MGRWQPDSRGRLQEAALDLYAEKGFDQTTAAQIAARAGLTERTFFRHFADKREVLFGGSALLQERIVAGVAGAPPGSGALDAVASGLDAAAAMLGEFRRDLSRKRQAVIVANPELRERELAKLADYAVVVAAALRQRGVREPRATLRTRPDLRIQLRSLPTLEHLRLAVREIRLHRKPGIWQVDRRLVVSHSSPYIKIARARAASWCICTTSASSESNFSSSRNFATNSTSIDRP